ncbi:phenylalanine--tRNA ligase subunit beta [Thermicanus aegyptius]|uniref:phenylalanine--tRNA ligase subunit beta n=1 Tax=Thermicanus aegyptius TaxID=94009 RepID=UPI0004079872|nr:phenylalanine--tRNA ligase subunit beta [Thermicanus aegyptius]
MRVSFAWLSQYVDLTGITPRELAEKLTRSGIEVDAVEERNKGVEGVVIGYVEEVLPHPNADRLKVCKVKVGEGKVNTIVTGAPNIAAGQYVPVAVVGAKLPGGVKIGMSSFRGIESEGMICSAQELGIEGKYFPKEIQEGILTLPYHAEVGEDAVKVFGLDDVVLDLDLTPNRSDCLSIYGVAYEVGAILGREVKEFGGKTFSHAPLPEWKIEIEATEDCLEYQAALIEGVKIAPSPQWMQNRLIAAGIRPINNVVDITNYVMLEVGQPLHAFDADKVGTGKILVRRAKRGEHLITLDGVDRELDEEMLLITDGERAIGLAGVMGGEETEVTQGTTTILLESAYFAGPSIRKTVRKLGLRSEASLRFEKGVDPARIRLALRRAVELMEAIAQGKGRKELAAEKVKEQPLEWTVETSLPRIQQVLGMELSLEEVMGVFQRLKLPVGLEGERIRVTTPSRRPDLTIEADLFEEVARLIGYDKIPITWPAGEQTQGGWTKAQTLRRKIREYLVSVGFFQVSTYSLIDPRMEGLFAPIAEEKKAIPVVWPMSEEHSHLRTTLLPSLLEVARYNLNRNVDHLFFFELSKVFHSTAFGEKVLLPEEPYYLAGLAAGEYLSHPLTGERVMADFYFVKGILEELFQLLSLKIHFKGESIKGFHPGRGALIFLGGEKIGYVGQIHPSVAKEAGVRDDTILFQLNVTSILEQEEEELFYQPIPRFPGSRRDISFLVGEKVPAEALMESMKEGTTLPLEEVKLFDVYQGEHVPAGMKSMAFTLFFRHPERTLSDDEVQKEVERIIDLLTERFEIKLRG